MTISKNRLIEILKSILTREELSKAVSYILKDRLYTGKEIVINRQKQHSNCDGELIFIDLHPGANWAHPSLYIYIDNKGKVLETLRGQFPPKEKMLIIEKPPHIQDWVLLSTEIYPDKTT